MKVIYISRKTWMAAAALAVLALVIVFWVMAVRSGTSADSRSAMAQTETEMRELPIYCVDTQEKKAAITFDASWGEEKTKDLLALLDEYDVDATFFLVGYWVDQYPDNVKAIAEAGHEIGSHSDTHPHMSELTEEQIRTELQSVGEKIKNLTGKTPVIFRPPYGDYNDNVIGTVRAEGLEAIQWNVDSLDWKGISGDEMLKRVKKSIKPGSIILFHNNSDNLLDGLKKTLDYLISEGYSFCRVSELIYPQPYSILPDGTQTQAS